MDMSAVSADLIAERTAEKPSVSETFLDYAGSFYRLSVSRSRVSRPTRPPYQGLPDSPHR
jgi:hypothetical protein